jgi:hypothetical protein
MPVSKRCEFCFKEFLATRPTRARYCSRKCTWISWSRRQHPIAFVERVCPGCGAEFSAIGGTRSRHKYCTLACNDKHYRDLHGAEDSKHFRKTFPERAKAIARKCSLKRERFFIGDWDAVFNAQDRKCANPGCRSETPNGNAWHTDHNHATKEFRTILCAPCNMSLGLLKEKPERILGLEQYLAYHNRPAWTTPTFEEVRA